MSIYAKINSRPHQKYDRNVKLRVFLEKKLYYPVFIRDLIRSIKASKTEEKYANSIQVSNCRSSAFLRRKKIKNADIFFLLGGAKSINNIQIDQWSHIKKHTSMGINSWFVHHHEPNFLMVEGYHEKDVGSEMYNWTVTELPKYLQFSHAVPIFKNLATSVLPWSALRDIAYRKAHFAPRIEVPGRTPESKKKAMRILRSFNLHYHFLLSSRASVTLGMSIALHLGFKKIVLCGFDLNDSGYFWEQPNFYKNRRVSTPPGWGHSGGVHPTMNRDINEITADIVIIEMVKSILEPSGVEVLVNSEDSNLHPALPIYRFPS